MSELFERHPLPWRTGTGDWQNSRFEPLRAVFDANDYEVASFQDSKAAMSIVDLANGHRLATYERVAPTRKTVKGRKAKQLATKLADPFDGSWKVGSLAPHSMKGKPSAK